MAPKAQKAREDGSTGTLLQSCSSRLEVRRRKHISCLCIFEPVPADSSCMSRQILAFLPEGQVAGGARLVNAGFNQHAHRIRSCHATPAFARSRDKPAASRTTVMQWLTKHGIHMRCANGLLVQLFTTNPHVFSASAEVGVLGTFEY